jgi:chitinase
VAQNPWDFTAFTVAFANHTSPSPPPTPTPTPTSPSPTPTPSPSPTGSCAAAWVPNTAYVSGNAASYGGHNWTANQWNYDEVPGGPSGA